MGKSITVKAETVEEAVQLALSITELDIENVHIEVLSNPEKSLFGLRKTMAEVTITEIIDSLTDNTLKVATTSLESKELAAARLIDGNIEAQFSGSNYPTVLPGKNVNFYMNGKKVTQLAIISPGNNLKVTVSDELIPPHFSIQLIEHDMLAMLVFTPGKKVKRTLPDTEFEQHLHIEADERIEFYNDVDPQRIVDRLKAMGIQKGLLFAAIKKVTEVNKPLETIVAKGVPPVEGLNGDLEVHIDYKGKVPDGLEKVDIRELNAILSVEAGQVIATHIPPVEGTDGSSLLGDLIPAKKVKDIVLRLGNNVMQIEQDIVARISGKPFLERRDKLVKIDVNHELHHLGDVDMESGNIRFEGNININGNIHPSMFVGATGTIAVGGTVTKATIHAMKSAAIKGNVFSSSISVGQQEFVISEITSQLSEIGGYLERILSALQQILHIRSVPSADLSASELKNLIRILLEKKYTAFQDLNKRFIQKVKNHSLQLSSEWTDMADKLYSVFVASGNKELTNMGSFEMLFKEVQILVELYSEKATPKLLLSVPYAINSVLYSNGNIVVTSKGLYHCSITAGHDITVKGVCRGGEINASHKIVLQTAGSENIVKTVIRTGEKGSITIGIAYAGIEIQVGNRAYAFAEKRIGVFARLNDDGKLLMN